MVLRRMAGVMAVLALATGLAGCGGAGGDTPDTPADLPDPSDAVDAADPAPDTADPATADVPPDPAPDTADPAPADPGSDDAAAPDVPADVPPDVPPDAGPWVRPEVGEPVTAQELAAVTDQYIDLLKAGRWFELLDERAHGWPEDDPEGGYWYGSWWSGVRILKEGGKVRYLHSADGADNNGMRTAPMLAGLAFAWSLWGDADHLHLARRIARGFNSWILAMQRTSQPDAGALMTRASYPASATWNWKGREVLIDYSLNRPGEDNGACQYVHLPDNPWWGDLYVKNMRSKDDIGHLLLAVALADGVLSDTGDAGMDADWAQLRDLYGQWSRRVEDDGWRIATLDKDLALWFPDDDLAYYMMDINGIDPECDIALATRLMGRGDGGTLDCGNGISIVDDVVSMKPSNGQQLRSYHEAAIALAKARGKPALVDALLPGLALRIDKILDAVPGDGSPPFPGNEDMAELMIMAANVGVPLTWREVRFFHDRVREAHATYLATAAQPGLHVFDESTPDGEYGFDPPSGGIAFRYIGAALGACASPFRHPDLKPLLECDKVRAAFAR